MSRESGGEVPGQQSLKLVDRMVGDALEDMAQVEFRVESVELRRTEQAVDGRSTLSTGVRSSEEVVLATQSNGAQGAFSRGVVHLDARRIRNPLRLPFPQWEQPQAVWRVWALGIPYLSEALGITTRSRNYNSV